MAELAALTTTEDGRPTLPPAHQAHWV